MAKLLTEFIGTFFLVLTIGLVVASGSPIAVLGIGIVLMVMVYMGGHVSGGHYNPAVSTAAMMTKNLPAKDFGPYMLVQFIASIVAAFVSYYITGKSFAPAPSIGTTAMQALLVETLFTFGLALVVLNSACSKRTAGNSFYGLAIGGTIVAAAFAGGPVSGGAFNPAVGVGPTIVNAVVGGGNFQSVWLYIVGPFLGGALASVVFKMQESKGTEEGTD